MSTTYETDFYAWANEQASLLRTGRLDAADIENIAEEIESMGRSEKRELISRLTVLMQHLLKWKIQPNGRCRSWTLTITDQRYQLEDHLADNPSLKSTLQTAIHSAYRRAVTAAALETGLETHLYPKACPWNFPEIMAEDFWPD